MTMKICFCLAVAVFCVSADSSSNPLAADFAKILGAIHTDKTITNRGIIGDTFLGVLDFLKSEEFIGSVRTVTSSPEFQAILDFVGPDVLDAIKQTLGITVNPEFIIKELAKGQTIEDIRKFISGLLPKGQIQTIIKSLLDSSPEFKNFYTKIIDPQLTALGDTLLNVPYLQKVFEELKKNGIDVQAQLKYLKNIFIV